MIEFAKLHIKAALEAASKQAYTTGYNTRDEFDRVKIDKDSILNAYPETNIV